MRCDLWCCCVHSGAHVGTFACFVSGHAKLRHTSLGSSRSSAVRIADVAPNALHVLGVVCVQVSCSEPETGWIRELVPTTMYSRPMSPHPKTGYEFPTLNKPTALLAWLDSPEAKALPDDHELVITDPDFVYLNPLPLGKSRLGRPFGGHYRFGSAWLRQQNIVKHCQGKCHDIANDNDAVEQHWVAGPPLFIRLGDFKKIAPHWFNITEQFVFEGDPKGAWEVPGMCH